MLPYLDVPFQHAHPDVLRRMKRPASGERNLERLARWREICPELVVRSTFIAGFPGETEAEFETCWTSCARPQIDRAGCFAYSPVEGAAANELPGQLPQEVREERRARFMAVAEAGVGRQAAAARGRHDAGAGGPARRRWAARAASAAATPTRPRSTAPCACCRPRRRRKTLKVGEFTRARIVAAEGHDLVALPI